jgi:hypothetical protein
MSDSTRLYLDPWQGPVPGTCARLPGGSCHLQRPLPAASMHPGASLSLRLYSLDFVGTFPSQPPRGIEYDAFAWAAAPRAHGGLGAGAERDDVGFVLLLLSFMLEGDWDKYARGEPFVRRLGRTSVSLVGVEASALRKILHESVTMCHVQP